LLATICLGVVPGLVLTLVAVTVLLLAAVVHPGENVSAALLPEVWIHVASLASVTLASALAGSIVNRLLFMALMTAEAQRRKNFESSRALRYREKLLRHALRVETIGDVAGLVCHQLRNAFQVLLGHVTMCEMGDDRERVRRLALIEETLQQTKPLLDELMLMAHPDEGSTAPTLLPEVLRQFHSQAKMVLPSNIRLLGEVADSVPAVLVNPRGLVHALWNLVVNARQAIVGEGSITLRCGAADDRAWIEIADTGCGIPAEVRDRIFDPYFTTKAPGQGTGLGLTAVARFVRGCNGTIRVESEVGRGTTFRMEFPFAVGLSAQSA
jgi:signal transduction histidine kinase